MCSTTCHGTNFLKLDFQIWKWMVKVVRLRYKNRMNNFRTFEYKKLAFKPIPEPNSSIMQYFNNINIALNLRHLLPFSQLFLLKIVSFAFSHPISIFRSLTRQKNLWISAKIDKFTINFSNCILGGKIFFITTNV